MAHAVHGVHHLKDHRTSFLHHHHSASDALDFEGADGNPYPEVRIDNEESFLSSFYCMELRRFERQMGGRAKSGGGKAWAKICFALVLAIIGLIFILSIAQASSEVQVIIDGYQCPSVESNLRDAKEIMQCLAHAYGHPDCTTSDPVVQYRKKTKECACCSYPGDDEPEVGAVNPDYTLYRLRRRSTRDLNASALDSVTLALAIILTILVIPFMIYMMIKNDNPWSQFFRWTTTIFLVWFVAAPFFNNSSLCNRDVVNGVCASVDRLVIFFVWCVLMLIVLFLYLLTTQVRRLLFTTLCNNETGAYTYWGLRKEGPGHYSYRPNGICSRRHTFTYRGGVDDDGKPHGRGEWSDDSYHGEVLEGIWEHGEPKGKFRSMEYGSGSQFLQRPVAYYSAREDSVPENLSKLSCGIHKADAPYFGMGMVELSIAGDFYEFLPKLRQEWSRNTMMEVISKYKADDAVQFNWKNDPRQAEEKFEEALVFVHGWGTDLELQLNKISQLLSLGKCWPHIKPFVFGWSCGQIPAYFTIKNHSIDYVDDMIDLFRSLEKQFEVVHVLCHSAGAELFFHCFPFIKHCFERVDSKSKGRPIKNDGLLDLANVILMNGDVTIEKFAEVLPEMMEYADRCTSYNDTRDVATAASTWVQRLMPASLQAGWRDPDLESSTQTWGRVVSPIWLERRAGGNMELHGPKIDEYMPDWYDTQCKRCPRRDQGGEDDRLDVIDCSYIDYNAGFSRHNYYALNSLMGEDICELISQRKSAYQRSHLARRKGNVFDYLAAPKALSY